MTGPVRTVTVVGAGTIGLAWTTLFLAHGLDVRLSTRRTDAERAAREAVELFAPSLPAPPADPARLLDRLTIEPDVAKAVAGTDLVQENIREQLTLKQELFAEAERAAPDHVLLLSSSSSLSADALGATMDDPSGLLVGHPFNPAHLMPLVELVPGTRTRPDAVERAAAFYRSLGKVPVALRRPMAGTPANRLQSALFREAVHLVAEGYLTAEEVDAVVTGSIGLRWGAVGPFQAFHLGGGPGGLRRMLGAVGDRMAAEWEHLGTPALTDDIVRTLAEQTERAYGQGADAYRRLAAARDARQGAVLAALRAGEDTGRADP
ncbi:MULTISPECIES: 3-hydroxyacyl-CoA dehydrogenase family protein [Streptomyces]|uniref:3-hydroxyacyl-CoA dehydrogenase family protein n=1 Tax=Streptomyces TaxID=1883 RepID=UPI001674D3A8|nr:MULTISPECIES: 3-hydroxyacyl-CoA dehydrogenase NAD-binding domain-containing protein [Streptomyces]MBK3522373.1 hydroxylacyl-CoA dehydrogenase [Streptomyces sp. MBT70]GGR85719.1 hydroxylacyl-CoA dehydrogenase [Streptomyces eurythermus]